MLQNFQKHSYAKGYRNLSKLWRSSSSSATDCAFTTAGIVFTVILSVCFSFTVQCDWIGKPVYRGQETTAYSTGDWHFNLEATPFPSTSMNRNNSLLT